MNRKRTSITVTDVAPWSITPVLSLRPLLLPSSSLGDSSPISQNSRLRCLPLSFLRSFLPPIHSRSNNSIDLQKPTPSAMSNLLRYIRHTTGQFQALMVCESHTPKLDCFSQYMTTISVACFEGLKYHWVRVPNSPICLLFSEIHPIPAMYHGRCEPPLVTDGQIFPAFDAGVFI